MKEGAEKIRQFAMGKLRKRDIKGTQKDKGDPTANESPKEGDVDGDFVLPVQKPQAIEVRLPSLATPVATL